jgi:filamentous hemagglutinin
MTGSGSGDDSSAVKPEVPPLPEGLVGTQDKKAGPQGRRHNSGPLDPSQGGTGDAQKDFDKLTGGQSAPAGDRYPPGTLIGPNGIALRPGSGDTGPHIEIPANDSKPHETLHY